MKRLPNIILAVIFAFGLITAPISIKPAMANPGDIYVPGDHPTISGALTHAASGDTIYVAAGTYSENIEMKPGVTVIGAGADVTTIDGGGSGTVVTGHNIGSDAGLEGFTITGGYPTGLGYGGGIYLHASAMIIASCNITGNEAEYGGGVFTSSYHSSGLSPQIINCLIINNSASQWGGGIFVSESSSPMALNCTIADNEASDGGGIYNILSTPTIKNSIVYGNTSIPSGDPNNISNYPISVTTVDYSCIEGGYPTGTGNTDKDPSFVGSGDYHLIPPPPSDISPCIDTGDNAFWGPMDLDLDGLLRIHDGDSNGSSIVDMGVYEYGSSPPSSGDTQPPTASNPDPTDGSYTADSTPDISVDLTDSLSGVAPNTIVLTVVGSQVTHTWDGTTVSYTPSAPFSDGDVVDVTLDASDNAGNAMTTPYSWSFTISPEYSLTLDVIPPGSGTVNATPSGPYYYNDTVIIKAVANAGWSFDSWSGDLASSTSPATIIMDDNKTVTAVFTATFNSAHTIKSMAVAMLESGKTGDKKIDKKIDKAIKHLDKSLDEKLWVDDTHLDEKHGAKVFNEEKKTIKELMHLLDKDKTPEEVKDICLSVINKLIEADDLLANTAYNEALAYAGDSKVDKELKKCDKEFEKAQKELGHTKKDGSPDPKYDKAIGHYKNAWKHAQKALGKAPEDD